MNVCDYDYAEFKAFPSIPNRIIECCKPVAFNIVGYPHKVDTNEALWRYADCMQETRTQGIIDNLLGGLTEEEFEAFKYINEKVMELTNAYTFSTASLLRSFNVLRYIRYIYPKGSTVLEIGGGSGYLGALLIHFGYKYISTDISQAFYVWQSHLFEKFGKIYELAVEEDFNLEDGCVHIPWWKFYVKNPLFSFRPDVITCNHCLCEMHPHALIFLLKLSKQILNGVFLFEGWGSHLQCNEDACGTRFKEQGFNLAYKDEKIVCYSLNKDDIRPKIEDGKAQLKIENKFDDIMSYICALIPEKMGMSDDEQFLSYIGKQI